MDHELARAERMLQHGGCLVSPDQGVPPDVPWESHKYYLERLRELVHKGPS